MREELIFRNIAQLVELPKYEKRETVPWTAEQSAVFLRSASDHPHFVGYLMMLTYGLRRGEMLGLHWSDIDFGRRCFHIRQQVSRQKGGLLPGSVKTQAGRRTLPLAATIEAALREHARRSGVTPPPFDAEAGLGSQNLVLTSPSGAPIDPDNFRRAFYLLVKRAGLPKITLHATRHIGATLLKNLNVPAKDAQAILGHANIATTMQIYQHGDMEVQRQAIRDVESALHTCLTTDSMSATVLGERPPAPSKRPFASFSDANASSTCWPMRLISILPRQGRMCLSKKSEYLLYVDSLMFFLELASHCRDTRPKQSVDGKFSSCDCSCTNSTSARFSSSFFLASPYVLP